MGDLRKYPREFIVDFIELYKSLPSLWKIKSKEYSNREKKANDYNILIDKLKEVEPNADRELVVKKINCMRSVYRRELKKYKKLKSGMGTEEVATPSLWYFDLLHFLEDQELPRQSTSTIEINENIELNVYNDSITNEASTISESTQQSMPPPSPAPSPSISQSPVVASTPLTPSTIPLSSTPSTIPSTSSSTPSMPSTSSSSPSIIEATQKSSERRGLKRVSSKNDAVLAKIAKELEKPTPEMDRFDHLSLSWSGILKNICKDQAIYAEKLINDVLFEAQLNNLSRYSLFQANSYQHQTSTQHFNPSIHQHQQQYPVQNHPHSGFQHQAYSSQQLQHQPYLQMYSQYQQPQAQQQQYQQPQAQQQQYQQPQAQQHQYQQPHAQQQQYQSHYQSEHSQQQETQQENFGQQSPTIDVDDTNEPENIVNLINNFKD